MEGLSGKCEMRLAERLRLGGVRVDELCHLRRQRLPVVDELPLGDELANPGADQMHAEHRPWPAWGAVGRGDGLDLGDESQVVVEGLRREARDPRPEVVVPV